MKRVVASKLVLVTTAVAFVALGISVLTGCGQSSGSTTTTAASSGATTTAPAGATTTATAPPVTGVTTTTAGGVSETTTTVSSTDATPTTQPAYTPAKGDSERAAIMDAQRAWMAAQGLPSDVVFVVDWLRVSQGWAYSQVQPESTDGANKYEGLDFLLQKDAGGWTVIDVFGAEGDVDIGPNSVRDYFLARHPSAPQALFP